MQIADVVVNKSILNNVWVRVALLAIIVVAMLLAGLKLVGSAYYHPPFIPVTFVIDGDGTISIRADASVATPVGEFGISADPTSHLKVPDNGFLMTIQHVLHGLAMDAVYQINEDDSEKIVDIDNGDLVFRFSGKFISVDGRTHHIIVLTSPHASGSGLTTVVSPQSTPTASSVGTQAPVPPTQPSSAPGVQPTAAPPTRVPTNPPTAIPFNPHIATHYAHGQVSQPNGLVVTTASCTAGEVLVSGGANIEGTLYSSYPVDSHTWAAEGSGSYVGQAVDAWATCVTGANTMNTTIVQSSGVSIVNGGDARVSCPLGQLLVGGGYRVNPPPASLFGPGGAFTVVVVGSTPMAGDNGWDVYAFGESGEQVQAYAVCSQNGFGSTTIRTSSVTVGPKKGTDILYACSGSELLTGGGGADITVTSRQSMSVEGSFPTSGGAQWDYRPYNYQDATQSHIGQISIVCASS
jgi:hypothetical protein